MLEQLLTSIEEDDLQKIAQPLLDICQTVVPVLLAIVGAVGTIFCIFLGVKYAKAEDPQEHEKMKKALKNAIIGFVIIFVLLIMMKVGLDIFVKWWKTYSVV